MRHVDAKIKILLVLFYYYNFTFVSIMNCDRQKFSIVTLHESKVHYAIIYPIPITAEEQSDEKSLSKNELLSVIQTLIGSLDQSNRPQLQGLKTKNKDQLLIILQQVQDIHNDMGMI